MLVGATHSLMLRWALTDTIPEADMHGVCTVALPETSTELFDREFEWTLQPIRIELVEPVKVTAPEALLSSASTQVCCPQRIRATARPLTSTVPSANSAVDIRGMFLNRHFDRVASPA